MLEARHPAARDGARSEAGLDGVGVPLACHHHVRIGHAAEGLGRQPVGPRNLDIEEPSCAAVIHHPTSVRSALCSANISDPCHVITGPVEHDPLLPCRIDLATLRDRRQTGSNLLAGLCVEMDRILERQPGRMGQSLPTRGSHEITNMPRVHASDFHEALGDQSTNQQVGEPQRGPHTIGERPLRDPLARSNGL